MPPAWKEQRARAGSKSHNRTALDRIPPERRVHVTDAMLRVVEDLREAVCNYVPRPYAGKAAVLVNAKKLPKVVGAETFWQSHLGGMEHEVGGTDHDELFYAEAHRYRALRAKGARRLSWACAASRPYFGGRT